MERRLAAILIADAVGYSRLMGEDEKRTLDTLKAQRAELIEPKISQHDGHIVKFMGDGILAEFSSAVEAVSCAIEIQRAIDKLNVDAPAEQSITYRIGINVGDIIVDGEDIYGEGVNIAARMESIAEPGGICISGQVFDQVKNKIDQPLEDLGEQKVKNITEPVRVYRVLSNSVPVPADGNPRRRLTTGERAKITSIAISVLLAGGVLIWVQPWKSVEKPLTTAEPPEVSTTVPVANEPSIAVLPFTNKSESEDQEYFADGITDDIITELTKVPGLLVISRDSTFNYRDEAPNLRELARYLNVSYVLQGSVRRSAGEVRINANLIEPSTGQNLWGDRYDGNLIDVFSLQDKITEKIVTALSLQLNSTDLTRIKRTETDDVQAYELFLKGRDVFQRFSREDTYAAQELFKQALAHDQNFANAYALLAWAYAFEVINGWSETPEKTLATALEIANKALSLNERQPVAYFVKVLVFRERREYKKALELAQKAIEINPNYANAYVILSTVLYYTGQAEEGLRMVEKAERINPMHPSNYPFHKGQALFILKQYDEAIEAFSKGLEQNPTSQRLRVWLAVAYAQAGQMEDAMWEAEQILDEDPDFKLSRLLHVFPFQDPADLEHFNVALRKLGLEGRW